MQNFENAKKINLSDYETIRKKSIEVKNSTRKERS